LVQPGDHWFGFVWLGVCAPPVALVTPSRGTSNLRPAGSRS
jgi:hypothetical protein